MRKDTLLFLLLVIIVLAILANVFWVRNYYYDKYKIRENAENLILQTLKDKSILGKIGSCSYEDGVLVYLNEGIPFFVKNGEIFIVNSPKGDLMDELASKLIPGLRMSQFINAQWLLEDCLPETARWPSQWKDKYIK